ncbi:hypothetical protein [Nocardia vermiculata]|uniref:Uncharacterized protein n=1 Tax=Nocardia vermiculata TaxID=257274 RepID=A0A846XSM3_9NOCA|nr:hypothetical protein [Nocardia vermiculata]NKY48784.1 hypothetical protein [Nocardia vermiculata]
MDEGEKRTAHRALVDSVLRGKGAAATDLRARAFHNEKLPAPLFTVIDKVASRPTEISDQDFETAKSAGFSEDQLFELVISAAVGQSSRMYERGLAALAEAGGEEVR